MKPIFSGLCERLTILISQAENILPLLSVTGDFFRMATWPKGKGVVVTTTMIA